MSCPTPPHLALLALLSVAGAKGPGEPCWSEMNLIKGRLQVNCSGQGLKVVPSALPNTTGILLLNTNHLASVSTDSFQHLPELAELDLSGNRLGALHTGATLPLLQELILSHNALGVLPTLQGLPALTRLALAHNSIAELLPGAFRAVGQLKELNLRGNRLRTLPKEAFVSLDALRDLDLSDNALEELPLGLLAGLELDTLRLSGNQLRTLPNGFFPDEHIFAFVFLAGNPWRCDCALVYLQGWITDNDFSVYIQEQRPDGLLTENDPRSPVCDAPISHLGSPVLDFQQACGKAGDADANGEWDKGVDLDMDGAMTEERTPISPITIPSTTLPTTTPVPPTTVPSTTLPPTIPVPPTTAPCGREPPFPPITIPSTTLPTTTPVPPTTAPSTILLPTTSLSPTTAPSTTLPPTTPVLPSTALEHTSPAPPVPPSTLMIPTTTLISSPLFHPSPLHIIPCHQSPPLTGPPPLCRCPTPPPAMPMAGRQQGREGPQWGRWLLAHCCLLHLVLYLASLLLLLLPMLALMGWMGWVYLGWYCLALRSPPGAQLVRYQLLVGERAVPPMTHLSSFKSPAEPPTFRTTKELLIHRDPPVPSFRRVTKRLLSVGGLGPWRAPSAYSLDRGEAAIGAVRVKYATTTL
ncbi:LOW QUALITY PROTEIN: platelet glycoprotein Ib alpha chain-like [Emydura macquarii macquarii]|uniref:LOW QUALITY PROTEIN: platelet glycoprotein Ib alpha chain-like n=1 Tax=Emydura macquarii macquarii TaxID=1129001 RepID=UPI00352B3318